ncbi:nucleolar protein 12 [Hydra vulgaris]|uniref:nucleolar protein 12 n=1 Tax=Hydra vulgaris TaxID=6087 RepID=UPI00019263DB|nr:nucleolar protein 12 [Hydra vulgaris]
MKKKSAGKKQRVVISFDEEARKEYLTGFRKRKTERKNKAKLEIERKLKTQINQERNKRRKVMQEKVNEILKHVEMPSDSLALDSTVDKVDFGSHEVLIKSDINFSDTGLIVTNNESEIFLESNEANENKKVVKAKPPKRVKNVYGQKHGFNSFKDRKNNNKFKKGKKFQSKGERKA